jgi:hypothetical protein
MTEKERLTLLLACVRLAGKTARIEVLQQDDSTFHATTAVDRGVLVVGSGTTEVRALTELRRQLKERQKRKRR